MELPDEFRKLEQMRSERRQWASQHYVVTERGLLNRFDPRASPEKRQQGDKEAECHQPARKNPPASEKICSAQPPVSPTTVAGDSSFNIVATAHSAGENAKPTAAARRDLRSAFLSQRPPGASKVLLQKLAPGRVAEQQQQQQSPAPSAGRGFLLHMSQAQVSRYSPSA